MIKNNTISFRPKLEGEFRNRFYNTVRKITQKTKAQEIEEIALNEIYWVEHECKVNLTQRKKYRAIWMLLRDLIRASWKGSYQDGVLEMKLPSLDQRDFEGGSIPEMKALLRGWMQDSRLERLQLHSDFIFRMERNTSTKQPISELIADGKELDFRLQRVLNQEVSITEAVQPYLQLIKENARDRFTGQKLSEIWRYFRLSWATPSETTPGRTMQYLIRDAAHPKHAVMGIASLENTAVQITCRDDYITWNAPAYIDNLKKENSLPKIRAAFEKLLDYLEDGISGIDLYDLCTVEEAEKPESHVIQKLQFIAVSSEEKRQDLLKAYQTRNSEILREEKSELGRVSREIETTLYKRKRADQLSKLLGAKQTLKALLSHEKFENQWLSFCDTDNGKSIIRTALIAQKSKHIGSSMLELNVCGAIPPYNEILGGKLVALLATSPQVIHDYRERYSNKKSEIASRLKGEDVYRDADLVYIGTSSLYYVGSSQYNRLKIPGYIFNAPYDIKWQKLGKTVGFGTLHISKSTTMCLNEAVNEHVSKINHIFGEGASPKMRLIKMAINDLLEVDDKNSTEFAKHAMSRIVYGVELAANTKEYLLGNAKTPEYYFDTKNIQGETQKIVDYWLNRWVLSRLNYTPIFDRIRAFSKEKFMISTELKRVSDWKFEKLKGPEKMVGTNSNKHDLDLIRNFYRGSSGYADFINPDFLSKVHVVTDLDEAIEKVVKEGKDVVLTGNPGDGKTHIIRVLKDRLNQLPVKPVIELDASTLTNRAIYDKWHDAKKKKRPFIIAINAAVLLSLGREFDSFSAIVESVNQMIQATVFHDENVNDKEVAVFDLSKREALNASIVRSVIRNMIEGEFFAQQCNECPFKELCPTLKNAKLLQSDLFQERLNVILTQVALQGYHATLRELQSFVSYLLFGDRSCQELMTTTGNHKYDLSNLIYSGKGPLFDAIRNSFDPEKVSHPIWDERILTNSLPENSWLEDFSVSAERINPGNIDLFNLRKRQFYFFNKYGNVLLNISDDVVTKFQKFLEKSDREIIRDLIKKLNAFFGVMNTSKEIKIWTGHRFNNSPRKILMSTGELRFSDFQIGRPKLNNVMDAGIKMVPNFIRFEQKRGEKGKEENISIFLKVDFAMYNLLLDAERGVPVLLMESDIVKKVWRFIEQLDNKIDIDDDETSITLFDVQSKRNVTVVVDRENKRYTSITVERK